MGCGELLARPVGIEDAQGDRLDAPQRANGAHVRLGGELADGVG